MIMKKISLLFLVLSIIVMLSTTAFAFGIPKLPVGGGNDNSSNTVDVEGLTNTANRIISKYNISTIVFASSVVESLDSFGLQEKSAPLLAARDAFQNDSTAENNKKMASVEGESMKAFKEAVKNGQITAEQAQSMLDNASVKAGAAGLINLSLIPDGIKILKDTNAGVSSLSRNPTSNMDGIKKLKSTIAVIQYMNAAMPQQEKIHQEYNAIISTSAEKYGATKPSQDQLNEAANGLIQG
jgi:hypothetical protein